MGFADFLKGIATKASMGFNDFLNGKAATPTDKIGQLKIGDDGIAQIDMGVSQNPRSGGFLQGFQENRTTPFAVENLEPNNKGWNFKLGEVAGTTARGIGKLGEGVGTGLKTVGRGLDSPWGRAALVGGIVGLTGGNPLQALTYGASTGMMNQGYRTKDKVYREQLKSLGMSDEEVNSIRGYVNDDIYKNVADSYKTRWNKANLGDLASFNQTIAEAIKQNPALANVYLPSSVATTILKGDLTEAQIANLLSQVAYRGIQGNVAQQNANTAKAKADSQIKLNDAITGGIGTGQPVVVNTGLPVQPSVVGHRTNAF